MLQTVDGWAFNWQHQPNLVGIFWEVGGGIPRRVHTYMYIIYICMIDSIYVYLYIYIYDICLYTYIHMIHMFI